MKDRKYRITILGAGNGGQAMAGHFGILGHEVTLFNRTLENIRDIVRNNGVLLKEKITGFGGIKVITDNFEKAIKGAEIIMVTTIATAHKDIAEGIAPYLENGQIIILNPGRTLGALEFRNEIERNSNVRVYIAEAQSLIYACRSEGNGEVRIIGVKNKVPLAALPSTDTEFVLSNINNIYDCFIKSPNILGTSLENIGAIFHPSIVMFNAATIERGEAFYFYNDMTPLIANFLIEVDKERLNIGKAFGFDLLPVSDWVSFSYANIKGDSLCEKLKNNPAYYKIIGPDTLQSRLILEDVPTGIIPFIELAKLVNVQTPLLESVLCVTKSLVKRDFKEEGRTFKNLGIDKVSYTDFINSL